ncbi:zinc finger protein 135-like [Engraulis encrasicolus]|uniref:zinc finger protein 135-like n=1 Tax=Engraulis encrasicolus TaxID=184585 RepID=UPI002FD21D72
MQLLPTALSGIKEEEADAGYEHSQTDGDGAQTERQQAVPLPVNIKLENMEDEGGCEESSTKAQTQSCRVGSPGEPPGHEHTETPSGGGGSVGGSGGSVWRRHLCPTCGRGFPYWSTLQLHMASHTQAIPQGLDRPLIVCARCGKTFSHRRLLEQHELTRCHGHAHAPERPYRCAQCGKTFALPKHLKQHQRIHSGEKPYSCHYCPKSFTFLGNLRVHERTHTGERPYACAACGKRFSFVGNLRTHERIHRRRDAEEAGPGMGAGTGAGAGLEWSEVVVQDGVI